MSLPEASAGSRGRTWQVSRSQDERSAMRNWVMRCRGQRWAGLAGLVLAGVPAHAQTTTRVSVATGGTQANGHCGRRGLSISADGRYVAFESEASNLVVGDTNALFDIFVHDGQSGTTERVSVDSGGSQASNYSLSPSISADGRYTAYSSYADNLVGLDTNLASDIFVRDRQSGTTELVSVDSGGA